MTGTMSRPSSLRSPGGGSTTNWKCQSTRRPPSIVSMAQNHKTKTPFAVLRAVHSPPATPFLGSKSKFPSRPSRGQKDGCLTTKAMLNSFTGEIMNVFALAQEETQHLVLKIGSNQIIWSHISQIICLFLLDLILNEVIIFKEYFASEYNSTLS